MTDKSLNTKIGEILILCKYGSRSDAYTVNMSVINETQKQILTAISESLPTKPIYPTLDDYIKLLEHSGENRDLIYDAGYNQALTDIKKILE